MLITLPDVLGKLLFKKSVTLLIKKRLNSKKKFMESKQKKWSKEKLLKFYKSFSVDNFVNAAINDHEMIGYIYAITYFSRSEITKTLHFEELSEDVLKTTIISQYENFIWNFEERINKNEDEVFQYVFNDSELHQKGGIFNGQEAVFAMRDEVLGVLISQVLNRFGMNIIKGQSYTEEIKGLKTFNQEIHSGSKYKCYKNHFLTNYFGLMVCGVSMIFQHELDKEDISDFDYFCDIYEEYMKRVMIDVKIDMESEVRGEEFSEDINRILTKIVENNILFYKMNYNLVEEKFV